MIDDGRHHRVVLVMLGTLTAGILLVGLLAVSRWSTIQAAGEPSATASRLLEDASISTRRVGPWSVLIVALRGTSLEDARSTARDMTASSGALDALLIEVEIPETNLYRAWTGLAWVVTPQPDGDDLQLVILDAMTGGLVVATGEVSPPGGEASLLSGSVSVPSPTAARPHGSDGDHRLHQGPQFRPSNVADG